MKIGSKGKKPKHKTTNVQEPSKPATNGTITAMSKEEKAEKSKENPKEDGKAGLSSDELTEKMEDLINPNFDQNVTFTMDEKVGFSPDEIAEKMEDLIKPKFDQNGAVPDPQFPPKYEEIDDVQKENSDKSSDTVVLADIHVSE